MTDLIGQDATEAHLLLLRGRVQIILETEVAIISILFKLIGTSKPVVNASVFLDFANQFVRATVFPLTFTSVVSLIQSTVNHVPF